jgi:hypothetical protein
MTSKAGTKADSYDAASLTGAVDAPKISIIAPILSGPRTMIFAAAAAGKVDVAPEEWST